MSVFDKCLGRFKSVTAGASLEAEFLDSNLTVMFSFSHRFGEKLTKIIILHPSWYLMLCVEEQTSTGLQFLR